MNVTLKYFDAQGLLMYANDFDKLKLAIEEAEKSKSTHSFEIKGMGQHLRGVRKDSEISWLGMKK